MIERLPIVRPSFEMALADVLVMAVLAAMAITWVRIVHQVTHNRAAVIVHACFATYLVLLAGVVLLPLHGLRTAAAAYEGTDPLKRALTWGLQLHGPTASGHFQWQRLANVLMTVPFGFGFGLLAPRVGVRRIFATSLVWAASLEFAQLSVSVLLGVAYRSFDINDIIDNALGASIGLGAFVVVALAVRKSGFGQSMPNTTLRGFIAESAATYFAGHRARRERAAEQGD